MEDALQLDISGIKCDNKDCDYKNEDIQIEDYEQWLNKPCPKCGTNLLTQEDLDSTKALIEITKIANKILPKSNGNEKKTTMSVEMNGTGYVDFKTK